MKLLSYINRLFILLLLSTGITVYSYAAGPLDHWSDNQLCEWMDQPSPPGIIKNLVTKKRIHCSGGIAVIKVPIVPSNAFDGNYNFKLTLTDPDGSSWSPGYGLIEITNGIVKVLNKGRRLNDVDSSTDKFDTFEGQIDKNGDFIGTFEFNACGPGDCEEEFIVLEGNFNNDNKLSGRNGYEKIITFELTKK